MKKVGELLTILLFISESFASEGKTITRAPTAGNMTLELTDVVNEEVPPKSSFNQEGMRENGVHFTERMISQALSSADKELVTAADTAENAANPLSREVPQRVPQNSSFYESVLTNMTLKNVTNLTKSQEEIKHNAENATKNFVIALDNHSSSSLKIQNSNLTQSELVQVIPKISPNTAEYLLKIETWITIGTSATTGIQINPLTNLEELQESEWILKEFPHILNRHRIIRDSAYEIAAKPLNTLKESEDLKHLSNVPENREDNDGNSSTFFSNSENFQNSNLSDSVLLQIVLNDKPNAANKQERIEETVQSSTAGNYTNKNSLNNLEVSENTNQSEHELTIKKSLRLSEKPHESIDNAYDDSNKFIVIENTTTIGESFLTAETSNSLNIFQNSNLTVSGNNSSNKEEKEIKHLAENSTDSSHSTTITEYEIILKPSSNSSQLFQNPNLTETGLVSKDIQHLSKQSEENKDSADNFTEFLVDKVPNNINKYKIDTKSLNSFEVSLNSNSTESDLVRIVLKDVANLTDRAENLLQSSFDVSPTSTAAAGANKLPTKSLDRMEQSLDSNSSERDSVQFPLTNVTNLTNQPDHNPSNNLEKSLDSNLSERGLVQISANKITNVTNQPDHSLEPSSEVNITNTADAVSKLSTKPLKSLEESLDSNLSKTGLAQIPLKELTNLTNTRDHSLQSFEVDTTNVAAVSELSAKPLNSLEQSQNSNSPEVKLIQMPLEEVTDLINQSDHSAENSFEMDTTTTTATATAAESTTKPLISLEEYAVKQMNFILDHLLLETQDFVANVLQASINSAFPRDNLKRYAEALNRVLNPVSDSDYSDEVIEEDKLTNQDKIYEEIVRKLNFLKSKPSKYLQKHLPQEWINDFLDKKAESAIWLDKATEQMHQELNAYISEEEDHIKYQYFNETFDDISRATEIHHKLALLADLVKIVKNKKQITFMDLYMQT